VCWWAGTQTLLLCGPNERWKPPWPLSAAHSTGHKSYANQPVPTTSQNGHQPAEMGERAIICGRRPDMATHQSVLVGMRPNAAAVWVTWTLTITPATSSGPQHWTQVIHQPASTCINMWPHTKVCWCVGAPAPLICGVYGRYRPPRPPAAATSTGHGPCTDQPARQQGAGKGGGRK
jgi:hypothetical protein